jgi:lipopolysaccharide transport system ATP-binding protein
MSDTVLQFENVGKLYSLGIVGTQSLTHDINRWWVTKVLRKSDPYIKIGEVNDRTTKSSSNHVWALRDITFNVNQGDVVGIIGRNGAGKSTLLKLLSRVTAPTLGTIKAKGRVASLLEVGTGFHPELTGRENIYMNGSIMGMRKHEITAKLDEIVDFAGVERYLDTPVKRYSSGMSVRLGFAVAAFLESEILVVDEVLAVGDAEFQKKAIGKMYDVANGCGRTVLFVSHNMASVSHLCSKGILLDNGQISYIDTADNVIDRYINTQFREDSKIIDYVKLFSSIIKIDSITINGSSYSTITIPTICDTIDVRIEGELQDDCLINLVFKLKTRANVVVASLSMAEYTGICEQYKKGRFVIHKLIKLPDIIYCGIFNVDISLSQPCVVEYARVSDCAELNFVGRTLKNGIIQSARDYGFMGMKEVD